MKTGFTHRPRVCACGCGRAFRPKLKSQRYINKAHKNKAAQDRWRKRVQRAIAAQQNGNGEVGAKAP